jgi:hypothetical protein
MTDIMETEVEVELKVEDLDKYLAAAAHIVGELGTFLASHYEELVKPPMTRRTHGLSGEMPKAADDPQYAAQIHRYKNACDAFCNVMRGVY